MKLLNFTVNKFFPYESVFLQDRFVEIENQKETEDLLKKLNYKDSGFHSNENITFVTPMHNTSLPMLKINWKEKHVMLEKKDKKLQVNLDVETIKEALENFDEESAN